MEDNEEYLRRSLDRLLLCNKVRELTNSQTPPIIRDGCLALKVTQALVRAGFRSQRVSSSVISRLRHVFMDSLAGCSLRLWLEPASLGKLSRHTIKAAFLKIQRYEIFTPDIAAFATSCHKEEPLIRVCLLLRLLKRYGACIDFLIRRLNSGLPATQTQQWLSFFLKEIGDTRAAAIISPK